MSLSMFVAYPVSDLILIPFLIAVGCNLIITVRMGAEVNRQLPPKLQFKMLATPLGELFGALGKGGVLDMHRQFFPDSSLRWWWWFSHALMLASFATGILSRFLMHS